MSAADVIANSVEHHLAPLTTATGLSLSVTALRNLHHLLAGTGKIEPLNPLADDFDVFVEVLGVDRGTAFRIWNHFRGHSGVSRLEDIEGVTPEIADRIRTFFRTDTLQENSR
jgi:hypothetical protein